MKSQISRRSFDEKKRYSGLYQQQGRMLTDADWNEQAEIVKERLNEVLGHVIGSGTPAGEPLIVQANGASTIDIQPGFVYVDGIIARVMNPDPATPDVAFGYTNQADFPSPPELPKDTSKTYALYVDVWERPVTSLEDSDQLRDPALRGADTTTRTRTMAQIKWCKEPSGADSNTPEDSSLNPPKGNALLTLTVPVARGGPAAATDDPCGDIARFEGVSGNYLFRVEVHDLMIDSASGEIASLTLKWSSENGAEQFPINDVPDWFKKGQWTYEFFNDYTEKWLGFHHAGDFPAQSDKAVFDSQFSSSIGFPYVRRWDGYSILERGNDGAWSIIGGRDKNTDLSAVNPTPTDDNRLELQLDPFKLTLPLNKTFVVGDYWQAAVREAELSPGDTLLDAQEPQGIVHHYLKMADLEVGGTDTNPTYEVTPYPNDDSRRHGFPSLTNLFAEAVRYNSTNNLGLPDAANVQEALDQLRGNIAIQMIGGDGQEAMPGERLPQPLRVRAASGDWPLGVAIATFKIVEGGGGKLVGNGDQALDMGTDTLVLPLDNDGVGECYWLLDESSQTQRVEATLEYDGQVIGPVHFSANLSIAEQVAYDPQTNDRLADEDTVQGALDTLDDTKVNRAGDTITGDLIVEGDLTVGGETTTVNTTELDIEDNIITVNRYAGDSPNPNNEAGMEVYRGSDLKAKMIWDETDDVWKITVKDDPDPREIATVDRLPSGVARTIHQPNHGLIVGQAIYHDGTAYQPALSSQERMTGLFLVSAVDVDVRGIPSTIPTEYFTLVLAGYVDGLSGLNPGHYYFVSDDPATPGALTDVEPLGISNPILFADTATSGYVLPYRPSEPSAFRMKEYVDSLLVGSVSAFGMETPPEGWLECNGQAINRVDYGRLFERIGETFGAGDGKYTFNVPDLRGMFVRGWARDGGIDLGRQFGNLQLDQLQDHTHRDAGGHYHAYRDIFFSEAWGAVGVPGGWGSRAGTDNDNKGFEMLRYTDPASIQLTGAINVRKGVETRPRNLSLLYCIKT